MIAHFSSAPGSDRPYRLFGAFKNNFAHAVVYGLLALWSALLLPRADGWPRLRRGAVLAILAFVLAIGVLDEWNQSQRPGRDGSWTDVLTDVVGALATLAVIAYAGRGDAREHGLWRLLAVGTLACLLAAANATFGV